MAPQPLTDAERDVRSVVATVLMLGNAATTLSIIVRNARRRQRLEVGVDVLELEAERRREVFLVAEQHVDERHQRPVDLARLHLAADRPPERIAVVEVVRHARAVLVRLLHRRARDRGRALGQRAEHAAGVEPARRRAPPNSCCPVDVAGLHLRHRGVAAVRAADAAARAEAALGEVQPVADAAPDAVVFLPAQVRQVDAALEHQVLDQPADRVVGQRGDVRGAQAEAAAQAARDVVFAAAFPGLERRAWCGCAPRRGRAAASPRPG